MAAKSEFTPAQQIQLLLRGRKEQLTLAELAKALESEGVAVTFQQVKNWSAAHRETLDLIQQREIDALIEPPEVAASRRDAGIAKLAESTSRLVDRLESVAEQVDRMMLTVGQIFELMRDKLLNEKDNKWQ